MTNRMSSIEDSKLWLALAFSELPVEVITRGDNRNRPVVVTTRQRVMAMNPVASRIGIQVGSSMDTAYSLTDTVAVFERDENREASALRQLAQWAYQFTPVVSLRPPDMLLLDISGCLRLWHGLDALLDAIESGIETLGYTAWYGLQQTTTAALCLARARQYRQDRTRPQGRPAPPAEALAGESIRCLVATPAEIEKLGQMGISTIGEVLALPSAGRRRRFSASFCDDLEKLAGWQQDAVAVIDETPNFESAIHFLEDITNIQSLAFPAKRLLQELCDFLRGRQLQVTRFTFTLSHRSHPPHSFDIHLASADNDLTMFLSLAQMKLEQVDNVPETDELKLTATSFFPADSTPGDLFHGTRFQRRDGKAPGSDRHHADRLVNMLRTRLGNDSCFGIAPADDHRPEKAWRAVPLGEKPPPPNGNSVALLGMLPALLWTILS